MSTRSIIVLSSGGKDSLFMLQRLRANPEWDVRALVTTVNETNGRVAMHGTPTALIHAQAEALGVPISLIGLPEDCDNVVYEARLADGLAGFRRHGITHVACGDLFLADIRQWREALFARLGWQPVFPIWHEPTETMARQLVDDGWQLTLTCVDTQKLSERFLGRRFDHALIDELPAGVDPCGENGEFHTFVHDGPGFAHGVEGIPGRVVHVHGRFAMIELKN